MKSYQEKIADMLEQQEVEILYQPRRPGKSHTLSLMKHLYVEWGTVDDWHALSELHYKGHTLAAGSRFLRCMLRVPGEAPQLVGVTVIANPRPLDGGRNDVFPRLRPNVNGRDNRLVNQTRLAWINRNLAWNNRTVLDTMYRGAGIAYRFKNLAYRMYCARYEIRFIESRSSMGRFNPFSVKTGMKFTRPKTASALNDGLVFFAAYFKAPGYDIVAVLAELRGLPDAERAVMDRKLREFYYKWSSVEKSGDKRDLGMTRVNELAIEYVVRQIQQLVYSATVYWIFSAPPTSQPLPNVMPLLAFDEQAPDAALSGNWEGWVPTWAGQYPVNEPPLKPSEREALKEQLKELERIQRGEVLAE
ncbi:hypothetical protein ATN89_17530 [Comamonas thiooxydans]|uniref:hypothetical protein n=1 Tax=Comamonas thiooxydans TaxID=363952 RepID=UPI0007C4DAAF|nr:hypothetical protein [Comamonas thiooxydans]OAD82883.1 hypothetical protein ATN89_17530 [Comamonas thiooxydans]